MKRPPGMTQAEGIEYHHLMQLAFPVSTRNQYKWRDSHPEKIIENRIKWNEANPGKGNELSLAWYRRNRDAQIAKQHDKKLANPELAKKTRTFYRVKKTYNITFEEYQWWMQSNDGLCHACNEVPIKHLDHDHETGQVRGALCLNCNWALGQVKDNIATLRKLIEYLEFSRNKFQAELYEGYLSVA